MKSITKEQFVAVLDDAGVSPEQKVRLHAVFETHYPEGHQAFLEWLGVPADTIREIRTRSRTV